MVNKECACGQPVDYYCPACEKGTCEACSSDQEMLCNDCPPPALRRVIIKEEEIDQIVNKENEKSSLVMQKVQSSNVSEIGYLDGTLKVKFKSGQIYEYLSVPKQYYDNIMSEGTSKGQAIAAIKKNFRSRRAGSAG